MSLLSAGKVSTNQQLWEQVNAAIRIEAATRYSWQGIAGQLAHACLISPTTATDHFMSRLAADEAVTKDSCPSCGHVWRIEGSTVDDIIKKTVSENWDLVAKAIYPEPKPAATEVPQ